MALSCIAAIIASGLLVNFSKLVLDLGLAQSHMEEKDLDKEEAVIIIHMQPEDNVS